MRGLGPTIRLVPALARALRPTTGPAVATAFHRLFALVVVVAWASLGSQITVLVGEQGLLPLRPFLETARAQGDLPLLGYPSLLRWPALATDGVLVAGTRAGVLLGLLAFFGIRARLCFALSTVLYLTYAVACSSFLAFQWDNLLLEVGLLAAFVPTDRAAPVAHLLLRLVLFKLYFESGLAKWQSPLRDWHDGSAMTLYFETAPLPTWLGALAHGLPAWWHRLESWATLALELLVPLFIFGPRRGRRIAAAALTGFQLVNAATANYGFFCPLSVVLHVFLLEDRDVERVLGPLRRRLPARLGHRLLGAGPSAVPAPDPAPRPRALRLAAHAGAAAFVLISLVEGLSRFGPRGTWDDALLPARRLYLPLRLVNTYQLFASITRERVEPEFQTLTAGTWTAHHLWHKPGDPARAPGFVAPHQPRVDFLLWFHGLDWERQPAWVAALLDRLCEIPDAVQPLFRGNLPPRPEASRVVYHQYRLAPPAERRSTGLWWSRTMMAASHPRPCGR